MISALLAPVMGWILAAGVGLFGLVAGGWMLKQSGAKQQQSADTAVRGNEDAKALKADAASSGFNDADVLRKLHQDWDRK
jgi:hypothetical protein